MKDARPRLSRELKRMLAETIEALHAALGENLRLVTLYGSYARAAAGPDSDVDLLVVLRSASPSDEDLVSRVTYDVMWDNDFRFLLSALVLDENEYHRIIAEGYSFARNVEREGMVLWPKAA